MRQSFQGESDELDSVSCHEELNGRKANESNNKDGPRSRQQSLGRVTLQLALWVVVMAKLLVVVWLRFYNKILEVRI